jgi:hypothetical protein
MEYIAREAVRKLGGNLDVDAVVDFGYGKISVTASDEDYIYHLYVVAADDSDRITADDTAENYISESFDLDGVNYFVAGTYSPRDIAA